MAHEAPTTKEDALITLLTHCTELELQTVFEQLQIHCMKNNCLHIIEKSFGIDQDEIADLTQELEDSEEALMSMTDEKDEWFERANTTKRQLEDILEDLHDHEISDSVRDKIQSIIDTI